MDSNGWEKALHTANVIATNSKVIFLILDIGIVDVNKYYYSLKLAKNFQMGTVFFQEEETVLNAPSKPKLLMTLQDHKAKKGVS